MESKSYDILIVGGGVIGSSIAYHLLNDGMDGTVAILEKDPTYEFASTPRSIGGHPAAIYNRNQHPHLPL
jgi:glycine/D-amino acid oxidase-like deaminating enzyme